jgi:hypothetical protein
VFHILSHKGNANKNCPDIPPSHLCPNRMLIIKKKKAKIKEKGRALGEINKIM